MEKPESWEMNDAIDVLQRLAQWLEENESHATNSIDLLRGAADEVGAHTDEE